ncbi:DUF1028 domain-containing protein [Alkalicoccus chagannorensis]|uniref:DUF1028 domain-containing protein n=1 Tax=Alkalicoccus chagannorensis TaxID=427072 RepID=UPI00040CD843|nr:DUF1028 domain-containing protein [Alkalicoccus chagannorensis]
MKMQQPKVATFSIIGHDPATGETGIAVQSKFLGAGAVVPWAEAGAGAVATQSYAETSFGPRGLQMLKEGSEPQAVIEELIADDPDAALRQFAVMNSQGKTAVYTGEECYEWAGHREGRFCTAQGNILTGGDTVDAMVETFEGSRAPLAERLTAALQAAQEAGGDARGKQSAALFVVQESGGYGGYNDRKYDLRVDDHKEPIEELKRLYELHKLYFSKPDPSSLLELKGEVLDEVELLLMKDGLLKVKQDTWNRETQEALRMYFMRENFEERWHERKIDPAVLTYMRADINNK